MVSFSYHHPVTIHIVSIWMITKYLLYKMLRNSHFSSLKKISHHKYELSYNVKGKDYRIIITQVRGPLNIVKVENSIKEDVTDKILSYYGLSRDFHGQSYKPTDFGFKSLKFHMSNDEIIEFSENEIIEV
jgi:hypothetical protein